jgi:short-subunit dehydrogenase
MKAMDLKGRWVMVTGASAGLGAEMARVLAKEHQANVVLVARRADKLEALAKELQSQHHVETRCIAADLSKVEEAERLFAETTASINLYAAVLNAGVTHYGHHDELKWDSHLQMLSLNVVSTTRLTTLLLPYLEKRGEQGGVMLVSSLGSLMPMPYQSAYSATKAYLTNFACGLHHEMWRRGVSITVYVPGGVVSEMTQGERFNDVRMWLMPAERAARIAVSAMKKRAYVSVPGFVYNVGLFLMRIVPHRFFASVLGGVYRRSLAANGVAMPNTGASATPTAGN